LTIAEFWNLIKEKDGDTMKAKLGLWKNRPWKWRIGLIFMFYQAAFIALLFTPQGRQEFTIWFGVIGGILMFVSRGQVKKQ